MLAKYHGRIANTAPLVGSGLVLLADAYPQWKTWLIGALAVVTLVAVVSHFVWLGERSRQAQSAGAER